MPDGRRRPRPRLLRVGLQCGDVWRELGTAGSHGKRGAGVSGGPGRLTPPAAEWRVL